MADLRCFTTKKVALLCRVSDATVKRWEEAGLIKSERTSGGHRRFRAEEVARFQRERQLGLKNSHGDESILTIKNLCLDKNPDAALLNSLLAGCEEAASNILISAHLQGESLTEIFDRIVCPAMRQIGELWFNGKISVAREHLATRVVINSIYKLRIALPVPTLINKIAMSCALENDFHELPSHLAQVTLENQGWEVMNFGANTPLYPLAEEILKHKPEIVCISCTYISDIDRLARDFKEFKEKIKKLKTPILLGGRVFEDSRVKSRFPADFYAQSFSETAAFAKKLVKSI